MKINKYMVCNRIACDYLTLEYRDRYRLQTS